MSGFMKEEFNREILRKIYLNRAKELHKLLSSDKVKPPFEDTEVLSIVKEEDWRSVYEVIENTTYQYSIKEVRIIPKNFIQRMVFKVFKPNNFKIKIFSESIKEL